MKNVPAISQLINEFSKLPSIGRKSAQRLAFHVVEMNNAEAMALAEAIVEVKRKVKYCEKCFNITDMEFCEICSDAKRNPQLLCVVESARDLMAIENTKEFHGLYHVLLGAISPLDGVGPNDIKLRELIERIREESITELIIATNPTVEGEATAMYLSRLLSGTPGLEISRIAHGVPVGGDLEYADEITLAKALEGRRKIKVAK